MRSERGTHLRGGRRRGRCRDLAARRRGASCCARRSTSLAAVVILSPSSPRSRPTSSRPSSPTSASWRSRPSSASSAIGVTLLMIGGHFDLSVGAVLGLTSYVGGGADARLGLLADPRDAGGGCSSGAVLGARQRADRRALPHPFLRGDARHHADLARRPDRADRRLSDDGRDPAGLQGGDGRPAARRLPHVDAVVHPASARSAHSC